MGNEIEFLDPIRNSLNLERGLGPPMYAAGLIDSEPGSLTSEHAEDPETARAIVRRYHALGYEEIKIYQSLKPELIPVVTAEAHRVGMRVTGHIPTGTDALMAVRNGMDMINHISFVTRVPREALRAATTLPTKVLRVTDSGSIEVSKRADLVILDANPLADIRNIRRVRWTVIGGKVFDPHLLRNAVDIRSTR